MEKFICFPQHDAMDCGITCIQMILNHYNAMLPSNKLRDMTGTDKNGVSALGLVKCLESLNFKCMAVEGDDTTWLNEDMIYPAIAHVVIDQTVLHYVVVYAVKNNTVYIADPARGNMTLSISAFSTLWTGVLILCAPTDDFVEINENVGGISKFIPLLREYKQLVLATILISKRLRRIKQKLITLLYQRFKHFVTI